MPDDTTPLSPAGDGTPPPGRAARTPEPAVSAADDDTTTWAGNRSLDSRWWWSPFLWLVVGAAVIGYQSGPIRSGEAIVLTWVMVAIGAVVAAVGLVSFARAYATHRATQAEVRDEPPVEG